MQEPHYYMTQSQLDEIQRRRRQKNAWGAASWGCLGFGFPQIWMNQSLAFAAFFGWAGCFLVWLWVSHRLQDVFEQIRETQH